MADKVDLFVALYDSVYLPATMLLQPDYHFEDTA
jgi:hypothetical protein